jgi:hypothetical protein
MMVASVGTIMIRPSLVQIGRSRIQLTGLVMRVGAVPDALCCLLTSPPSAPALPMRRASHSPRPMGERVGLEDSITTGRKEKVHGGRELVCDSPVIRDSPS